MKNNLIQNSTLPFIPATEVLQKLNLTSPYCLFESSEIEEHSGRLSLLALDPAIEFIGKGQECTVNLLDERRKEAFNVLAKNFKDQIVEQSTTSLKLAFKTIPFHDSEEKRFEIPCAAQVLRFFLKSFYSKEESYTGLYGALGYNFVYPFEEIKTQKEAETADFHLYYFDTILVFNHLMMDLNLVALRASEKELLAVKENISKALKSDINTPKEAFEIGELSIEPSDEAFKNQILEAKELFAQGEVMELVLSRKITASVNGDSMRLYEKYKLVNPSPYMFYFQFGSSQLFGASPEIMVKVEKGKVYLKPISGTAPRGKNAIEDHERQMELLNSDKEKSELDMLIDLGRNDLARICKPGVSIDHYRSVEKYSHVFHTVARLSGDLEEGKMGVDALIACLNAGTLTGTPKNAAMQHIENMEQHSRGYYGGCVGYLLMNGEVNTAITIRSAHIKNNTLSYLSGATLLYECDPDFELTETKIKAAAFQQALKDFQYEKV
ncbi:MAG: anthranilate synthase component 1 [Flavobacteriales bacterium]|jgi:anthranilate synthase component 1